MKKMALLILSVLVMAAGCTTITGRPAGQWVEDQRTTARVKTALAGVRLGTLTRVNVDTYDGTVYLIGRADSQSMRQRAAEVARGVIQPNQRLVNNLYLEDQALAMRTATDVHASPSMQPQPGVQMQPGVQQPAARPADAPFPRFARVEAETRLGRDMFAAYDASGRRVATIHSVPAQQLQQQGVPSIQSPERVDHVSVYPHPGSNGRQVHIVLWHVSMDEARQQQQQQPPR